MSTAIPPAPPPLPPSAAGASGPVSVTVVSGAVDLAEGAVLEAVVQARVAKGIITALTPNGPLELKAGVPLPPIPEGARLLLQAQGSGADFQLKLVAINGRTLGGPLLPQAGMGALLPGGVAMAGLLSPGALQQGATPLAGQPAILGGAPSPDQPMGITATLIRPAAMAGMPAAPLPPGLATMGLAPNLPAGTQLTVRIAEIGTPAPQAANTTPAAPPLAASTPAAPGLPAQPGPTRQGMAAPTPSPATPPSAPAAPLLPGTVTAQSPGGNALVHTPVGTLTVPTHMELPAGTPLTLEIVGKPVPPPPPTATASAAPQGLTPQGWPAMTQALDTLAANPQAQAVQDLLRMLPQAGPRLAASMMAFTGSLQSGETRRLLPEPAMRGLEKAGKKELAERLKADLDSLSEDAGRPVGNGEWRGYTMPFLNGGVIEPIHLFVRAPGDEGGGGKRGGGTGNDERFVLDISLSSLGRLQMDGLVRREDKMFDLIIRTESALSPEMRRDIQGIFANASEVVGTKGSVSFQSGGRWIEFPPAPPPPTRIEA
jgi:hypothetical protein